MFCFLKGKFVEANKALISIAEGGFRFGDGIFDSLCVYKGKIYQWDFHLQRIKEGLEAIKINIDLSTLEDNCCKVGRAHV